MNEWIFLGYEAACGLIPALLVLAVFRKKLSGRAAAVGVLLALYAVAVFEVTGAGTLYDFLRLGWSQSAVQWVPFSQEIDPVGYVLNVVMLVPFGLLCPLLGGRWSKPAVTAAGGFALSLLIELSQLFNYRGTDVDDLLMNTAGALAGWVLWRLARQLFPRLAPRTPGFGALPVWIVGAVFAGRFFLCNHLGLVGLLYGA